MKEIKNPLIANIDRSEGNIEISIAKKYSKTEEPVYKKFMGMCAMNNSYAVETKDMDDEQTTKACGSLFTQEMESTIKKLEANVEKMLVKANLFSQPNEANLFEKINKATVEKLLEGGLSQKQKKNLPAELKKTILQKMKSEGKITANLFKQMNEAGLFDQKNDANLFSQPNTAAESKLLSKDDQKKKETGPHGELKKVDNPKEPKVTKKDA